jgi:hypothetical protein
VGRFMWAVAVPLAVAAIMGFVMLILRLREQAGG